MQSLRISLLAAVAFCLAACSRQYSSSTAAFAYHSTSDATMRSAQSALQTWLSQHGFQPVSEPASARVAGVLPGVSAPGMTDRWYSGSFEGSAPFYLRVVLLPPPAYHLSGEVHIQHRGSEIGYRSLEKSSEKFTGELRTYAESLPK